MQQEWLKAEFIRYSVDQVLYDCHMARQHCPEGVVPILLLHTLSIVADTIEDWIGAMLDAGCEFVSLEEALSHPFYQEIEGTADKSTTAVTYFRKFAEPKGIEWPEIAPNGKAALNKVKDLGRAATKAGHVLMHTTQHTYPGASL